MENIKRLYSESEVSSLKVTSSNIDLKSVLLSLALFCYFAEDAITGFFSVALNTIGVHSSNLPIFLTCSLIYIPAIIVVLRFREVTIVDSILLFVAIVLFFTFSYFNNPQNQYFFTRDVYGVERVFRPDRAIYAYFILRINQDNSERVWRVLRIVSIVLFLYWSLTMLNALNRGYWEDYDENGVLIQMQYNLTFGYNMLLPVAFFFFDKNSDFSKIFKCLAFIGILEIFIAGSRGPLICVGIMLLIKLFQSLDKAWAWFVLMAIMLLLSVILIVGIDSILLMLKGILDSFDVSSRTLNRLISGTVTDENGRDLIWAAAIHAINEQPLFGYGVYGDRPLLYSYHFAGYPHNIFLELCLQFGVLVAFIFVVIALLVSIKMLFIDREDKWGCLFAVFFVVSCQLILSMSFWYVSVFWAAIAVVVNALFSQKNQKLKIANDYQDK